MPMRSRIPALLALTLALCALPGVHAFAAAWCAPCCDEAQSQPQPCAVTASDCCALSPAAPASVPAEHTTAQPPAPALVTAPHGFAPTHAAGLAPSFARQIAAASAPARLSVVRLL
jgi:hypothetical protein